MFYAVSGLLAAYAVAAIALLVGNPHGSYPAVHIVLDTGTTVLSGVLAAMLWVMGRHVARPLLIWLAIGFAATAVLDLHHVLSGIDAGALSMQFDGAATEPTAQWAASAHVLPIAVAASLWLLRQRKERALVFGLIVAAAAIALSLMFARLPIYVAPTHFGITAPSLMLAPVLWLFIGIYCWRERGGDRLVRRLVWMAPALFVANLVMLYSETPHDTPAMVGHLGAVVGYLVLLLLLLKLASTEMHERVLAEGRLADLNEEQERRVRERTSDLEASNSALESEIRVRREAEQNAQAQLGRLSLLHRITRAIGERQDLASIFRVVVDSLEDQLPVDFCCLCLHDGSSHVLTVSKVGEKSGALAREIGLTERTHVGIEENGLSPCMLGKPAYEPNLESADSPLARRMLRAGLRSVAAAPLQLENRVFAALFVARRSADAFNLAEREFLSQLSAHVALAAHQAQLYGALQQAYDDLQQTQQQVLQQERLRALGQMASGIGHDINNALSPIALHTETILENERELSPHIRDYVGTVQRAISSVSHTVTRMREFYRPRAAESAQLPIQVNDLVMQVIDLTHARWSDMPQQSGQVVTVRTDLAAGLPKVAGVESEIREALINLIFNAVDAMPKGGTLTLRSKAVPRPYGPGAGYVQIDVADTGIGMNDETRRRCMEPFFSTKGERGGGLGLASVYGVVRRHGAEIDIRSVQGRGTTVSLVFPVPAIVAAPVAAPPRSQAAPERLRVLVVDDDPLFLKTLGDLLESDGHIVTEVSGGQAAIDAFRDAHQRKELFSAVITDLGMPYVDGRRVAGAIKEISPATPVIMLTGWGQRLMSDDEVPPNIDRVLTKPPKLRELRQTLAELCKPDVLR